MLCRHKPKRIVILSEVFASLREANTQSKDLYSFRTRLRPPQSKQPSMPRTVASRKGSFDSVSRFAKQIGQTPLRMTGRVEGPSLTDYSTRLGKLRRPSSLHPPREILEYSAPAQIAAAVSSPIPSQNGPSSTCPRPNSAM
jgi:hypothetical protein